MAYSSAVHTKTELGSLVISETLGQLQFDYFVLRHL